MGRDLTPSAGAGGGISQDESPHPSPPLEIPARFQPPSPIRGSVRPASLSPAARSGKPQPGDPSAPPPASSPPGAAGEDGIKLSRVFPKAPARGFNSLVLATGWGAESPDIGTTPALLR